MEWGIGIFIAVSATKHVARDVATVDDDIGGRNVGCVTAAIDAANGGVALVDDSDNRCAYHIAGIAAAIDVACYLCHIAFMSNSIVADSHNGVARHLALSVVFWVTLAAAIDVAAYGAVLDVHRGCLGFYVRTEGGQVAAAEHVAEIPI